MDGFPEIILKEFEIEPDPGEIVRYLGYPAGAVPEERVQRALQTVVQWARGRCKPRGMYSLYRIASLSHTALVLENGASIQGAIGDFLTGATRAAVFLATAGKSADSSGIDELPKDALIALALHALGAHLAEAAVEALMRDLHRRLAPDEALTLRYSPGYCGIPISQQASLFRLLDAGRIGVELMPSMLMRPLKTVSGIVGIGPSDVVRAYGNPCDTCPLTDCMMRRASISP